jgi:hypothetical protein
VDFIIIIIISGFFDCLNDCVVIAVVFDCLNDCVVGGVSSLSVDIHISFFYSLIDCLVDCLN